MPYEYIWRDAELVVCHQGVCVYRAYKDNDIEQPRDDWFLSDSQGTEDEAWDIRDLVAAQDNNLVAENPMDWTRDVLKQAIETGELTADGPAEDRAEREAAAEEGSLFTFDRTIAGDR